MDSVSTPSYTILGVTQLKLNLSQAAEKAGVSRNTLYKHIKEGKVSAQRDVNGRQSIELSELLRAYGALNGQSAQDSEPKPRKVHTSNTAATPLEVQLAIAEERVRQLEARLQEKAEAASKLEQQYERIIQGLESQVRLLEHKQVAPVATNTPPAPEVVVHPPVATASQPSSIETATPDDDPRAIVAQMKAKQAKSMEASSRAKKDAKGKKRKD